MFLSPDQLGGCIAWLGSVVALLIGVALGIYIYGSIFRKAGYSGWLALLMFIPLVNVGVLLWFATTTWPLERWNVVPEDNSKVDMKFELKMALRRALALEKVGKWDQAVKEFSHVVHLADGTPNANLAQEHIRQIQAKRTTGEA